MRLKSPTFERARTVVLLTAGVFILVYNAVIGDHNLATFATGLMLCGFPVVLNLDNLIRPAPPPPLPRTPEPVKEPST